MSKKIKLGPDWLQAQAAVAIRWMQENTAAILLVIVPVVVVSLGAFGWHYVKIKMSADRRADLAQVDALLQEALEVAEKQRQDVQEKIDAVDKKAEPKAAKEKVEVLTQELEAIEPDYSKAVQQYTQYFESHSADVEGWRAAVEAAVLLTQKREKTSLKSAADLLKRVLETSSQHEVYGTQVRMMLISLLEELDEYQDALQHTESALLSVDKDIRASVLMVKARILRGMGQNDDAKEVLNEIISQHAEAPEAQKARAVLAL